MLLACVWEERRLRGVGRGEIGPEPVSTRDRCRRGTEDGNREKEAWALGEGMASERSEGRTQSLLARVRGAWQGFRILLSSVVSGTGGSDGFGCVDVFCF